jgi:hypothetical protein
LRTTVTGDAIEAIDEWLVSDALMTEACRALPEPVGDYPVDDYLTNLVATVVDFQTHTTAVERALEHFSSLVRPGPRRAGRPRGADGQFPGRPAR